MPRELSHGRSGYRRGCKCGVCRAGHAQAVAEWRARKRAEARAGVPAAPAVDAPMPAPLASAPALDPDAPPGRLEQLLAADLNAPGEKTWKGFLSGLALYNARMLDQLPGLDRLDLISSIETRTLEVLQRLAPPKPAGDGGLSDEELRSFMTGLTSAQP